LTCIKAPQYFHTWNANHLFYFWLQTLQRKMFKQRYY
jgi:hypothetical protein